MRKKFVSAVAVLAALAMVCSFALVGCGGNKTASDNKGADTANDQKLVVGFDQDFPPYGYLADDGGFTGFDLDLAAEVAKRNNWEIEYVPISWDAKDLELSSGAIDCIWNGFTIEGREDGYEWSDPYMNNTQVVVVRTDSGISTLADLSGKTVMAQADSSAYNLLAAGGDQEELAKTFTNFQTTPEYNTAFMELESGAVNAVAIDEPVAKFQIQGKEGTFKILPETLSTEHYGIGFLKGNTELRDKVQATLLEMDEDGTVKTICEKYADQGVSYDSWILGK